MTGLLAAVLAGGASTRMHRDKAFLRWQGVSLLARTVAAAQAAGLATVVIGRPQPAGWQGPAVAFRLDTAPRGGPLVGVLRALELARGAAVVALPCDAPGVSAAAVQAIAAWRWQYPQAAAVLAIQDGHPQPLPALYGPHLRVVLARALAQGERSLARVLAARPDVVRLPLPPGLAAAWGDCDTPGAWAAWQGQRPSRTPGAGARRRGLTPRGRCIPGASASTSPR